MGTAQASGIALLVAARRGLPVALHTPSEVKAAVTGSGRADKAQVGAMVTRLLRLTETPKPADAADALALAICHIWRGGAASQDRGRAGGPGNSSTGKGSTSMIAFVRGRVAALGLTSAVLEVGGVGLELQCTPDTLAELRTGAEATLPTSMVVREDSLTLFGFADEDEKQMFELVQTASGVGPKLAQAMLAVHRPEALRRAVSSDDVKTLTTVPGIGQKGAQRIILELRDRIGLPGSVASPATQPTSRPARLAGPGAGRSGRPRLVDQGGRPGDRRGGARGRADGRARRGPAPALRAADAEQGLRPEVTR